MFFLSLMILAWYAPTLPYLIRTTFTNEQQTFSILDHSTTWVRTALWFRASPHNGIEFDNFLGSGPFWLIEGSHLCHHGHCLNPFHLVYEDYRTNKDRNRCRIAAQEIRALGLPIPKHCVRHKQEPCLLQVCSPYRLFP
jgi:hypothetical protein